MIKQNDKKIIVIGGGPAGMMAAITAAKRGRSVLLLEKNEQCGRKILATGNGRCNYTNKKIDRDCYNSNPDFALKVIERFDNQEVIDFFRSLGVVPKYRDGYVYPYSDQAQAIRQALVSCMNQFQVQVETGVEILEIVEKDGTYKVKTKRQTYFCDGLIVAAGSKASPKTGSDGSGYELLKSLGVICKKPLPALTALRSKEVYFKSLSGIRCEAKVSLMDGEKMVICDTGELQLTEYGISGIPVFQISGPAVKIIDTQKKANCIIDFLPMFSKEECMEYIRQRIRNYGEDKVYNLFSGLLNNKLTDCLTPLSQIKKDRDIVTLMEYEIEKITDFYKKFPVEVTGYNSFDYGQVCQGGVKVSQINPSTMECLEHPGLFVAGEIVDVDGKCGGYNLQWAFSSGFVAGEAAAR